MEDQHRFAGHFGVASDHSNRAIRTFIPGSTRMIAATAVRWLDGHVPADGAAAHCAQRAGEDRSLPPRPEPTHGRIRSA